MRQLDDEQTQQLIADYQAGGTVYELGDRFGIDRRTVSAILKTANDVAHRPSRAQDTSGRPVIKAPDNLPALLVR